jgi:predicted small secreted protein
VAPEKKCSHSSLTSVLALLAMLLGTVTMTGCNTFQGAGEDVENAGDAVKDAVD